MRLFVNGHFICEFVELLSFDELTFFENLLNQKLRSVICLYWTKKIFQYLSSYNLTMKILVLAALSQYFEVIFRKWHSFLFLFVSFFISFSLSSFLSLFLHFFLYFFLRFFLSLFLFFLSLFVSFFIPFSLSFYRKTHKNFW
jgi:hypothetical protein